MDKIKWIPRGTAIIIKGLLKPGIEEKKIESKKEDSEINEVDIIDVEGNYYVDDYVYYLFDKGEFVKNDMQIGDEIIINYNSISEIAGLTDRKLTETYFMANDGSVSLYSPAPQII